MGFGSGRHAYADTNCNGDGNQYANSNVHTHGYCHRYFYGYGHCDSDGYFHCDSDGYFHCHRYGYFDRDGYGNCYRNSHCNSHSHTNGNAHTDAYTDSETHASAKNYAWTKAAGDPHASAVTGGEHWWNALSLGLPSSRSRGTTAGRAADSTLRRRPAGIFFFSGLFRTPGHGGELGGH